MTIRPIETRYRGFLFRSRLEARWARLFDNLKIRWEYEREGYETPSGRYLPDFWLPQVYLRIRESQGVLFEVKPDGFGSGHDQLESVANELSCGAILVNGFECESGYAWSNMYQISGWDHSMALYICPRCSAAYFNFCCSGEDECPVCGVKDFDGRALLVSDAYDEALRYRFW